MFKKHEKKLAHNPSENPKIGYNFLKRVDHPLNPIDIDTLRDHYAHELIQARRFASRETAITSISNEKKRAAATERRARVLAKNALSTDIDGLISFHDFSVYPTSDEADDIHDGFEDLIWECIELPEREWKGDISEDGSSVGNGRFDELATLIYEDDYDPLRDTPLVGDHLATAVIDLAARKDKYVGESKNASDKLANAYADLLARPWSIKARHNAKKLLGINKPMKVNDLRNHVKNEWLTSKQAFYEDFRDYEEAELAGTYSDDEINSIVSGSLISWDIDNYTKMEHRKVESMKAKKLGKIGEWMHRGPRWKRAIKYLGIGTVATTLGAAGGFLGSIAAPILTAGAISSRLATRYASKAGRPSNEDPLALATTAVSEYKTDMNNLMGLDRDDFFADAIDRQAEQTDMSEGLYKKEQNARRKSVGFALGTIMLPRLIAELPIFQDAVHATADQIGKKSRWVKDHIIEGRANEIKDNIQPGTGTEGDDFVQWNDAP